MRPIVSHGIDSRRSRHRYFHAWAIFTAGLLDYTTTDRRYSLSVPAGSATIEVEHVGLDALRQTVTVSAGSSARFDAPLKSAIHPLDSFVVQESARCPDSPNICSPPRWSMRGAISSPAPIIATGTTMWKGWGPPPRATSSSRRKREWTPKSAIGCGKA
ncbi:MAG: hypothetical protein ACREH8_20055 [Opitutaceae bacterium]